MTIAFDAMLHLAETLNTVEQSETHLVTGTSTTTTLVSTKLTETDDYWNGGTLFITYDAAGSGAAPQNESREITDFVQSTYTVTVSPAFTAAPAIGDKFAIADNEYPRRVLLRALNSALRWYGDIITQDDTSLDTAANTLEYTLPSAAVNDLRQVYIATAKEEPYQYKPFPFWQVDIGSGKLKFRIQPEYTYNIRLVYHAPHTPLNSDDDTISPQVDLQSLYFYALAEIYQWKLQSTGRDDKRWADWYNQNMQLAEATRRRNPPARAYKDPSYADSGYVRQGPTVADPS